MVAAPCWFEFNRAHHAVLNSRHAFRAIARRGGGYWSDHRRLRRERRSPVRSPLCILYSITPGSQVPGVVVFGPNAAAG